MTGLRYSPLHVTELCGEMQGNFKVGCARLIIYSNDLWPKEKIPIALYIPDGLKYSS